MPTSLFSELPASVMPKYSQASNDDQDAPGVRRSIRTYEEVWYDDIKPCMARPEAEGTNA